MAALPLKEAHSWLRTHSLDRQVFTASKDSLQGLEVIKRNPGGYGRVAIKRSPQLVMALFTGLSRETVLVIYKDL